MDWWLCNRTAVVANQLKAKVRNIRIMILHEFGLHLRLPTLITLDISSSIYHEIYYIIFLRNNELGIISVCLCRHFSLIAIHIFYKKNVLLKGISTHH